MWKNNNNKNYIMKNEKNIKQKCNNKKKNMKKQNNATHVGTKQRPLAAAQQE